MRNQDEGRRGQPLQDREPLPGAADEESRLGVPKSHRNKNPMGLGFFRVGFLKILGISGFFGIFPKITNNIQKGQKSCLTLPDTTYMMSTDLIRTHEKFQLKCFSRNYSRIKAFLKL